MRNVRMGRSSVILALGLACAAGASEVIDLPALPLPEALVEAATNATAPAIAQARIERVRALQSQARALLFPTVTLNGSYGSTWESRRPYAGRSDELLAGQAEIALRLFDGSVFPGLKSAKTQFLGQERASRDLRRNAAFSVASIYLTVITAERLKVVATRRLDVANQLLEEARARLTAGLAIASDVTRAEVVVADSNLSLSQADEAIALGRIALQEAMGGRQPGALSEPLVTAPEDQTAAALVIIARNQRDDLAAARSVVEAAGYDIEVIRRGSWPVIGARAGVSDQDGNAPQDGYGDTHWSAGLVASWSLYDGGVRAGRIDEREALNREQRVIVRVTELAAEREVRTALVQITTAVAGVSQAEARSRSALADAADALARYRAGTGTAIELADAQYRSFAADADLAKRRIDVLAFRLSLRQALGSWPLSDKEPDKEPGHEPARETTQP